MATMTGPKHYALEWIDGDELVEVRRSSRSPTVVINAR
jgi:hypothetical protein